MGCAMSKSDASDVILQSKVRKNAIKDAVNCRQDFAIAHVAYMQTLRNVGIALRRFSEGEVSETSPPSPSSPVLRLPEISDVSTPDAILSPPRAHSGSSPSASTLPPGSPVSGTVAAKAIPEAPPNGAGPLSQTATLPAAASPPASSRASHFSQSSPPPLTQASTPGRSIADVPPSASSMFSPDRVDDFSPPFYSPRHNDADDYYMAYSPLQRAIPSPPMSSNSSWFMYDIFDAPPIPYNLLEQRRRKLGGGFEGDDEEEITLSPVPDPEGAPKDDGIPDLEEVEAKDDEDVRSARSVEKFKTGDEKPPSAIPDQKIDKAEKPGNLPEEKVLEVPVNKSNGKVSESIVIVPSSEKVVVIPAETNASPKKELAIVTAGQVKDLTGAVRHIHTHFARACRSGKDVSSMLEAQTIYHHMDIIDVKDSTKVFNAITMHWNRKSSLAMRDAYDDDDMPECGMFGSHASTLERLYAWEKKLYEEIKAGETVRIAFDRKCKQLHNLDARGGEAAAIDKTRVALKKLDTRLIVALQAIHLASTRIQKLTDEELYPQLAELLGGLMGMWKVMLECHKAQAAIASEMQTIESSVTANAASEAHITVTSQLEWELENWQTQFERWINSQRNYIRALHSWLSSCQFEPEKDSIGRAVSPHWSGKPAVFNLLSNWKTALLNLEEPQRAMDAIRKFSGVVHSLETEQSGELILRKSVERSTRDLDYRSRSLRRVESKYLEYKEEATGSMADTLSKTRADVDNQRSLVESSRQRHTEVMLDRKEKTLSRLKEHLPTVFESMASFAGEAIKAYERLHPEQSPAKENGTAHLYLSED